MRRPRSRKLEINARGSLREALSELLDEAPDEVAARLLNGENSMARIEAIKLASSSRFARLRERKASACSPRRSGPNANRVPKPCGSVRKLHKSERGIPQTARGPQPA